MTTKPSHRLTLKDRLSRLTFTQACKLLGDEGRQLIQQGGKWEIDLEWQVYFEGDLFRVKLGDAVVTITLMASAKDRLHWNCTACQLPCLHAGAAFSLLLEEKTALGLAAPPREQIPVESLSEQELHAVSDLCRILPLTIAVAHLFGLMDHPLVNDALFDASGGEIRCEWLAKDVEAANVFSPACVK
jgi:hypothetical protein